MFRSFNDALFIIINYSFIVEGIIYWWSEKEEGLQIHILESTLKQNCTDKNHFQLFLGPSILLYNLQLVYESRT